MVQDRFSSDNPYVISQQLQAANSTTKVALSVILTESDQVHSTNVFLNAQALTNNPSNPVSAASNTGQQAVGSGVATGGIQPDGNPCFLGHIPVTYWDGGILKTLPISQFYGYDAAKLPFALSFAEDGSLVRGKITRVYKRTREDYLHVTFSDHTATDVAPEHRYWTGEEYVPIKDLLDRSVLDLRNEPVRVEHIDHVFCPKGIVVYNMTIEKWENYVANGHRVHNRKIDPSPNDQ